MSRRAEPLGPAVPDGARPNNSLRACAAGPLASPAETAYGCRVDIGGRSRQQRIFSLIYSILMAAAVAHSQPVDTPPGEILPGGPIDFSRTVVLFYSIDCPYCHQEMEYLEEAQERYRSLEFVQIEIDESGNEANREFFEKAMAALGSGTNGWPRTVVGNRVFAGFDSGSGPLQWLESYKAYGGYQNQIEAAIRELNANAGGAAASPEPGSETQGAVRGGADSWRSSLYWGAGTVLVLLLYVAAARVVGRRSYRQTGVTAGGGRRLWIGGGVLILFVGIFGAVAAAPTGRIAAGVQGLPFPLMVTAIALLDGFNPCAFTVLFILLSLLTHTRRRGQMVAVGGVFIGASAAVYVAFILAMIALGSFALTALGDWVLRVIGGAVLAMGVVTLLELFGPRGLRRDKKPRTSLSGEQKAGLSRRAGRVVRSFVEAESPGARLLALGATAVLAVVVNGVELGCTAILPAVYTSSLLSSFGAELGAPHVLWTLWYGVIYVLPMAAILLDFVITFRSERLEASQGRRLKLAGAAVMVLLGGTLAVAPQLLVFG